LTLASLDRQFEAQQPNRKWVPHFHLYLDGRGLALCCCRHRLLSRRVVGWSMSATMTPQLVADALIMAIWRRGKPRALLDH
jgi:putative transposase